MSNQFASERPGEPHDPFAAAKKVIEERRRASPVVLQRGLNIGYTHAVRLLGQMTEAGLLGPDTPDGSREILFALPSEPPRAA
jgi:DNA segregation ATPase FtsK/SpoIIIE-like protein